MEDKMNVENPIVCPYHPKLTDTTKFRKGSKKSHFWSDGLCLDESRVSVLVISLLLFVGLAFYMYIFSPDRDIPISLQNLLIGFIMAIAGANAISSFARKPPQQPLYYIEHDFPYDDRGPI